MTGFIRPAHNTSWYGYARAATKPTPVRVTADGETTPRQVRVDVFVREFLSVRVKELKESGHEGRGGVNPVSVVFDGSSVVTGSDKKLRHDFGASLVAGSRVHDCLAHALATGTPVYVGIETKRRYKSKNGEVIPYLTPMHVLRGSQPDGSKGNSSTTGENCSNVVAAVGLADNPQVTVLSDEAVTDPACWPSFRHNRDGSTPPTGWQHVYTDTGNRSGAIIKADTSGAETVDAADIARQVAALLTAPATTPGPVAVHRGRSVEGKPWEERNSDGRINPAGPMVQAVRFARADAIAMVKDAARRDGSEDQLSGADLSQAATQLIEPLLWAACKVQHTVLGYSRKGEPSYREAARWVSQVVGSDEPYSLEYIGDRDSTRSWIKTVVAHASELYRLALEIAEQHVTAEHGVGVAALDNSATSAAEATAKAMEHTTAAPPTQHTPPGDGSASDADGEGTLADRPDLQRKWEQLIEAVNMTEHIDQLNPILVKNFGTHMSHSIPADRFDRMVTAGLAQPQQFWQAAKEAAAANHR